MSEGTETESETTDLAVSDRSNVRSVYWRAGMDSQVDQIGRPHSGE